MAMTGCKNNIRTPALRFASSFSFPACNSEPGKGDMFFSLLQTGIWINGYVNIPTVLYKKGIARYYPLCGGSKAESWFQPFVFLLLFFLIYSLAFDYQSGGG